MYMSLDSPQSSSGSGGEQKNAFSCRESNRGSSIHIHLRETLYIKKLSSPVIRRNTPRLLHVCTSLSYKLHVFLSVHRNRLRLMETHNLKEVHTTLCNSKRDRQDINADNFFFHNTDSFAYKSEETVRRRNEQTGMLCWVVNMNYLYIRQHKNIIIRVCLYVLNALRQHPKTKNADDDHHRPSYRNYFLSGVHHYVVPENTSQIIYP
jgi:hypothetical protein